MLTIAVSTASAQTFTVLYEFGATDAPMLPSYEGIIAQGRDGNLYTPSPSVNSGANSTAFKITPGGEVTVLNYFIEGSVTESGLTLGTDGNFYGTTEQAISDAGEVFKMAPSGVVNVLHTFTNGSNGGGPMAPPIEGIDGNAGGSKPWAPLVQGAVAKAGIVFTKRLARQGSANAAPLPRAPFPGFSLAC
jgi:uncharacterized repeat protein (TIGR03803 family)